MFDCVGNCDSPRVCGICRKLPPVEEPMCCCSQDEPSHRHTRRMKGCPGQKTRATSIARAGHLGALVHDYSRSSSSQLGGGLYQGKEER